MRKTTNYGLSLYDTTDKMSITSQENSLNANMEIIDEVLKEKATLNDMTTYIEEHKNELKGLDGVDGKDYVLTETDKEDISKLVEVNVPSKVSQLENDKNYLSSIPLEYVTENELSEKGYATENFVANKIAEAELSGSDVDLSGYATKDELNAKVDKIKGKSLIDDTEIERLANVDNYNDTELKNLINSKADKTAIPSKVSQLENDENYITSIPSEYITETELNNKGYLTEHQDISHLATKDELNKKANTSHTHSEYLTSIPSEYITETELNNKGYLTQHQDLSSYAKTTDIPTKVSELTNDKGFITSVPSEYVTETKMENFYTEHKDELKGATGATGATGNPGKDGVGISSVTQTTTSSADGGTNVITVTKTDGTTSTFSVKNGSKGSTGANGKDGSDANVTKTNIVSALGYTPANDDDVKELQEEIGEIETDEDLTSLFNFYEGYLNTSGTAVSHSGAGCTDFISVNVGDVFIWSGSIDPKYNYAICEYNASKGFISGDALITVSYTLVNGVKYTVKKGNYVRICTLSKAKSNLVKTKEYIGTSVINNKTDEYMKNATAGYLNKTNGQFVSDSNSRVTDFIPVNSGDIFLVSSQARYNTCGVAYYNASKTFISATLCNTDSSAYVASAEQITVPSGVSYARFGTYGYSTNPVIVQKLEPLPLKHSVYLLGEMVGNAQPAGNYLAGKKYVACGDSFTEGDFTNYIDANGKSAKESDAYDSDMKMYKTYPYWIAKRNSMTLVNEAKCGSDFTNISGASNPFSVTRYTQVPKDADYITIMFGLNETGIGADTSLIGTKDDTTNATLWGAYNIVFEYLITNIPYAKIGVILPDAWLPKNYADAVKEICKYWGIPCLDLKGDDSVPMLIGGRYDAVSSKAKSLRNSAFQVSSSDSHPNVKAHEYRSTIIENFMRSL